MKVLGLNGSPRRHLSSTHSIMKPFFEGMELAGAQTEILHLRNFRINPCIGCYKCWDRTPGECILKDEMDEPLRKFNEADMVVFGTPLYHYSMTGILKDFIDRLLPRSEPWLVPHPKYPNLTTHPRRGHKPGKIFLIACCGFPEYEHFETLVPLFRQIARMEGWEHCGELLRAGSEPLSRKEFQPLFGRYFDRVREAGRQLAANGRIDSALDADLRKDLFAGGKDVFIKSSVLHWKNQMAKYMRIKGGSRSVVE